MSSKPWYKRYGADFVAGTLGMSLEEKGAYSIILDLIYDRNGSIPDEPRYIAGVCGCSVRKWNVIRVRLIELGKISSDNGMISNSRADKEIENRSRSARKDEKTTPNRKDNNAEKVVDINKNNDLEIQTPPHSQKSEVRSQKESAAAAPERSFGWMCDRLSEVAAEKLDLTATNFANMSALSGWIANGCDFEQDILPTVKRLTDRQPPGGIHGWGYFTRAIAQAKAEREAPLPEISNVRSKPSKNQDDAAGLLAAAESFG